MELHRFPREYFDPMFDGKIQTFGVFMVDLYRNSNNFTKADYAGKDAFYDEYTSYLYTLSDNVIKNLAGGVGGGGDKRQLVDEITATVENVINQLAKENKLNPTHFLMLIL